MPRTIKADGKTIVVPDDATDEEINQIVGPAPAVSAASAVVPVEKPGLLQNLLPNAVLHPLDAAKAQQQDLQDHPVRNLFDVAMGPGYSLIKGAAKGALRSGGEVLQGINDAWHGNGDAADEHYIKAIPFAGPALDSVAKNPEVGGTGSYLKDMGSVIKNPGAMGTLLNADAQIAPLVLGGVDAAMPERSLLGEIPTKAKAGNVFESLNTDLANTPVKLNQSLAPLQRTVEIGARGSTLPKAVSDLLARSESPIGTDMTFPEARDYQSSLSDLSASDKMAMNGRMRGGVAQLNKGLFGDIQDAADTAGRGDDYAKAMRDYRRAAMIQTGLKNAGKVAGTAAVGGLGFEALHKYLRPLLP